MEPVSLGLALLIAKVTEGLALWAGLPGMVGPLIAGVLVGKWFHLEPLSTLGAALLVFFAGSEEVAKAKVDRSGIIKGSLILLVPTAVAFSLLPSERGLEAALIASIPGVGVLARLIRERGLHELTGALVSLVIAETIGIILFSGFSGGPFEVALGALVAVVSLKLGERALKGLLSLDDHAHGPDAVAGAFLALLTIFTFLPEKYGFSYVILALALGLLTAEYLDERPWTKRRLKAISETFLEPLFFLSVGASGITLDWRAWVIALIITLTKFAVSYSLFKDLKVAIGSLSKGGADSALLLGSGLQGTLYSVPLISILLGALLPSLFFKSERLSPLRLCCLPLDSSYLRPDQKVKEVKELMKGRLALPVVEGGRPIGMVTAVDLLASPDEALIREIMEEEIPTFECSTPLWKIVAMRMELSSPIVAVTDEGKYRGFLEVYRLPYG